MRLGVQARFLARRWFASDAKPAKPKTEADLERERKRQELLKEFERGYFSDIAEMRKNNGKTFLASKELARASGAIELPRIKGVNLKNEEVDVASLVSQPARAATLIGFGWRASARPMLETYLKPFLAEFGTGNRRIAAYEVSGVDGFFFRMLKGVIVRSLQSSIPSDRHGNFICCFEDGQDIRNTLLIKNPLVGHVYLVDPQGKVRWRAHSNALPEEIESMLKLTKELAGSRGD